MHFSETATNTVANQSATAASASSDLYGMAILNACKQITTRLQPVREHHPEATWQELVMTAYTDRICLSASGFYR